MTLPYGFTTYTPDAVVSSSDLNRRGNVISSQLPGALSSISEGVVSGLAVSAGAGLSVDIAAGAAIVNGGAQGWAWLTNASLSNLPGLPDNTTQYIFITLPGSDPFGTPGVPAFAFNASPTLAGAVLLAQVTTLSGAVTAVVDQRAWAPIEQASLAVTAIEAAIGWPYGNAATISARLAILEGGGLLAELFGNGRIVGSDSSAGSPIPKNAGVSAQITLPSGGLWLIANQFLQLNAPVDIAGPDVTSWGFLSLDGSGHPTVLSGDWYASFPTGGTLAALQAAGKPCLGRVDTTGTAPSQVVTAVDTYGHGDLVYSEAGLRAVIDAKSALSFTLAGPGRVIGADLVGVEPIVASPAARAITLPVGSVYVQHNEIVTLAAPLTFTLDYYDSRRYVFLSREPETGALQVATYSAFPSGGTLTTLRAAGAACLGRVTVAAPGNGRIWNGSDPTVLEPAPDPTFVYLRLQQNSEWVIQGSYLKLGAPVDINPPFDTGAKYGFISLSGGNPVILDADWFVDFPTGAQIAQLRAGGKVCVGLVSCLAGVVEGVNATPGPPTGGEADLVTAPVATVVDARESGLADLVYSNAGAVALLDRQVALAYLLAGMGRIVGTDTTTGQPTAQHFGVNPSPPTAQWTAPGSAPTVTLPSGGQYVIGHRLITLAGDVVLPLPIDIMADGTVEAHETHTRYGVLAVGPGDIPVVTWLSTLSGRPANEPCFGKITTQIDRVDTDPDPDLESWQTTVTYTADFTSATGGADFVYTTADLLALIAGTTTGVSDLLAAEDATLRALIAARTDLLFEYAGNGRVAGSDPTVLAPVVSGGALRLRSGSHWVIQGSYIALSGNVDLASPGGSGTFYGFLSLSGSTPTVTWETSFGAGSTLQAAGSPCVGKATVVGSALTAFDATAATGLADLIYTQAGLLGFVAGNLTAEDVALRALITANTSAIATLQGDVTTLQSDVAALQTAVALLQSQVASSTTSDLEWQRRVMTTASQAYDRPGDINDVPSTINIPGLLGNGETLADGTTANNNDAGGNWTRDDLGHKWE